MSLLDDHENAIVYALEAMRDSHVWRGPLRIDGSVKEFAEDVLAFVKAADNMKEGRNVVSLSFLHRVEEERDTLRAQVEALTKEVAHVRRNNNVLLEDSHRDNATIATLTKERDEARDACDVNNKALCITDDQCAQHLATIEKLRDIVDLNESKPFMFVASDDRQQLTAEVNGAKLQAFAATGHLLLTSVNGVVLANLKVFPHENDDGSKMTEQAAIEEIGSALMWSHQRSFHIKETSAALAETAQYAKKDGE